MTSLSGRGDAFFYAKLPTSDVQRCIELGSVGFAVIDTRSRCHAAAVQSARARQLEWGIARPDQYQVIPKIAERCFRWSRFHLDPKIPAQPRQLDQTPVARELCARKARLRTVRR